jgi:hypothetical protein
LILDGKINVTIIDSSYFMFIRWLKNNFNMHIFRLYLSV